MIYYIDKFRSHCMSQYRKKKKNVILLFGLLVCLSIFPRTTYAVCNPYCSFWYAPCCTTDAEAKDQASHWLVTAGTTTTYFTGSLEGCGRINGYSWGQGTWCPPEDRGGPDGTFCKQLVATIFFTSSSCPGPCCNNLKGSYEKDGILICCGGNNDPCCGKKIGDPCCKKPDDRSCVCPIRTGSGRSSNNTQGGDSQ